MQNAPKVKIVIYRWAGAWGPFKVKIPCGECTLSVDIIQDTIANELAGIPVELKIKEWLTEWWKPLVKGGWHAPIVMVDNKVVSQGYALNRGILTEAVVKSYVKNSTISGNRVYGKLSCPHCIEAKHLLDKSNIDYYYHDVVQEPFSLYEMIARVKPIVGPKTPITVPQIWLNGQYVGGSHELSTHLNQ
ncbi:MAG: hypothetical protein OXC02_05535 [Rhodobacteraceae bacterium]|nr:hypothetical protein [Paracoccaceae bacterium]